MEHKICNESLANYVLKDTKTGRYVCNTNNYTEEQPELSTTCNLQDAQIFFSKIGIAKIADRCGLQIRRIKVIDMGGERK